MDSFTCNLFNLKSSCVCSADKIKNYITPIIYNIVTNFILFTYMYIVDSRICHVILYITLINVVFARTRSYIYM